MAVWLVAVICAPVRLSCCGSGLLWCRLVLAVALWCGLSVGAGCAVLCGVPSVLVALV